MMADGALRERIAAAAADVAGKTLSLDAIGRRLGEIYEKLV